MESTIVSCGAIHFLSKYQDATSQNCYFSDPEKLSGKPIKFGDDPKELKGYQHQLVFGHE